MASKLTVIERAQRIIARHIRKTKNPSARCQLENISFTPGYSEPGYDDPESGWVAFGNWNKISRYNQETHKFETLDTNLIRCAKLLKKLGIELEWEDEWTPCNDCGKAVRTQPNSYRWKRSYVLIDECDIVCESCLRVNKPATKDYLKSLEGKCQSFITLDLDLAKYGYRKVEQDYENGLYGGQSDSPKNIGKALEDIGITRYLFDLNSVGQFDCRFSVWIHKSQWKKFLKAEKIQQFNPQTGPDPAIMLAKALRSKEPETVQGEGVRVSKINLDDGTIKTKLVSPEDFVNGKALKDDLPIIGKCSNCSGEVSFYHENDGGTKSSMCCDAPIDPLQENPQ